MKLTIYKINTTESITLDFELTATVDDLFAALYKYRSKTHKHLSFNEYQQLISVYQCILYGDRFKKMLLPGTNLIDYQLESPCDLIREEFPENQYHHTHKQNLFWKTNAQPDDLELESELQKLSTEMRP